MAKAKAKPAAGGVRLVRLSNGDVEREDGVGSIVVALQALAVNNAVQYEMVAQWVAGQLDELPGYVEARLRQATLLQPGLDPPVLYDDVKAVIVCCTEWTGKRARFSSRTLLHADQSNLVYEE